MGEATASPTAYSLISDYFPKRQRATALAIYSSGLYIGGGVSLLIGAKIGQRWNAAYPAAARSGWSAGRRRSWRWAFPGLLMALWVATLREPVRGAMDGVPSPALADPVRAISCRIFRRSFRPSRSIGAWQRGPPRWRSIVVAAGLVALFAWAMIGLTGNVPQWLSVGLGLLCGVFVGLHA